MSAVERLEAAIAKLETQKAESTPGEWNARQAFNIDGEVVGHDINTATAYELGCTFTPNSDAELIVTLHRTIDAQLAFLRAAVESVPIWIEDGATEAEVVEDLERELALADAILGSES